MSCLKFVFGITISMVDKCFIANVFQKKIASFNETSHFIFFINTRKIRNCNNCQNEQSLLYSNQNLAFLKNFFKKKFGTFSSMDHFTRKFDPTAAQLLQNYSVFENKFSWSMSQSLIKIYNFPRSIFCLNDDITYDKPSFSWIKSEYL